MLRISDIKVFIEEDKESILPKLIKNKLKIKENQLKSYSIFKESIDARRDDVHFIYTIDAEVSNEEKILEKKIINVSKTPDLKYKPVAYKKRNTRPPVIVGFGPSGLFAALILAEAGCHPIVVERGSNVDQRAKDIDKFWKEGILNQESNVQFGEGGAGTFSDGKLTTRIKDIVRCRKVLKEFVKAGADENIYYQQKPHIGTDVLREVIKNIRKRIIDLGGEIRFESKMTDFIWEDGQVSGIEINGKDSIQSDLIILAIGHSARDTYKLLKDNKVFLEQKSFAMGLRIEHPQKMIDYVQYGRYANHPKLDRADYQLTYRGSNRSVYTFCMCPGGEVIASASEAGKVVTNGMSYHDRSGENSNSAILVEVRPEDYDKGDVLDGIDFQRRWEERAFEVGGGNYFAPCQRVKDFLGRKTNSQQLEEGYQLQPTYKPGVKWTSLEDCLPDFIIEGIKNALPEMGKKLKGFDMDEAILTGVETRSSSPVRIKRDEHLRCSLKNVLVAGEGAGYAGGIISAAVDGIKAAEAALCMMNGEVLYG